MTGRRLYELYTDSLAEVPSRERREEGNALPTAPPKAWAFLTNGERRMWNRAARRVPVMGRRAPGPGR